MFDDLGDPSGPPAGDALGRVLTRARRRRVAQRGAFAFVAPGAVAIIAVGAGALDSGSSAIHVTGTSTTTPAPTTTAPPSTATTASTTQPASEFWASRQLTITPRSLGQVVVGMSLADAQAAAGLPFDGAADGAFYPTTLPTGFPHLFVNEDANNLVSCVGAEVTQDPPPNRFQFVSTREGFLLGETVQQLLTIYGHRARFVPAPSGGISPRAGYIVREAGGNLAFYLNSTQTRIYGIKGGGADLTPSSCNG